MKNQFLWLAAIAVGGYLLFKKLGTNAASAAAVPASNGIAPIFQSIQADPSNAQNYASLITASADGATSLGNAIKGIFSPTTSNASKPVMSYASPNSGFDSFSPQTPSTDAVVNPLQFGDPTSDWGNVNDFAYA